MIVPKLTSVAKQTMDAAQAVRSYKQLSNVERAFLCFKSVDEWWSSSSTTVSVTAAGECATTFGLFNSRCLLRRVMREAGSPTSGPGRSRA